MKNVLLATDFSLNAHVAAIFAAEIAHLVGARLVVFFAFPPFTTIKENGYFPPEPLMQKKLDALAWEVRSRFGISVTRVLKPGFPQDELPLLAERLKATALVMGAKGESRHDNRLIGSVAHDLLSRSEFPVVCIPAVEKKDFRGKLAFCEQNKVQFCNKAGGEFLEELISQNSFRLAVEQQK